MRLSTFFAIPATLILCHAEEATRTIEKTLPLAGNNRSVAVCTISGNIRVTGSGGNEVRITVKERLEANSRTALDELKRETDVVFAQEAGEVRAGVKGPWSDGDCHERNRSGDRSRERRWRGEDIRVQHDFEVSVPRDARLEIRNVNGSVSVRDSAGNYSLGTVNGGIEMIDMEGSGNAKTVNGSVKAVFRRNPQADSSFQTVNGKLDLYFDPSLNADFTMKTLNGRAFTDFEMSALPSQTTSSEGREGMKVIYRRDMRASLRAGSGGAKITTETLNGDILIHSTAKGRP